MRQPGSNLLCKRVPALPKPPQLEGKLRVTSQDHRLLAGVMQVCPNLDSFIEVTDQKIKEIEKCIFIKLVTQVTQLFKKFRLQTFLNAHFSFTLGFV